MRPSPYHVPHVSVSDIESDSSIKSEITDMTGDIKIPAPVLSDFKSYIEWLEDHFSAYILANSLISFLEPCKLSPPNI